MMLEVKERIAAALLRASLCLVILGLLALVAAFRSPLHRLSIMCWAQALSLCGFIACMGGWRLLLNSADPTHEQELAWWSTTATLIVLLGIAYWVWVSDPR